MSIKTTLKSILKKAIKNNNYNIDNHDITIKKDKKTDDYLSDITIIISDVIKKSPQEIVENLKNEIKNIFIIENISITDKGFLRLTINKEYLSSNINSIIEEKDKYGKCNIGNNQKINIEFINDNILNKVTLDDIRKTVYIDNIARLMSACGYNVTKEIYLNEIKDVKYDINIFKDYLDRYRLYFEKYQTQHLLYNSGIIEEVLTKIKNTTDCYINEDSLWIKTTNYGMKEDIKLIDKNGEYTEIVPYLSYLYHLQNQDYNLLINLSIPKLSQYLEYIKIILFIIKKELNLISINNKGEINVLNNNEKIELIKTINNIDINNIRFHFSCYNIDINMNFDINYIKKTNNENPIYYIEKTYNRILQILRENKKNIKKVEKYITLNDELSYTILEKINTFEDIIIEACNKRKPNLITNYIYELVSLTNKYCESEIINNDDDIYKNERLNLLLAIRIVLNNSLNLIGIIPKEEM